MTTPVLSWDEISQAAYDAALARVSAIAVERFPELEARAGVIADVVLGLQAGLLAATELTSQRRASATTVAALRADAAAADPESATRLLSNYGIAPAAAAAARGSVLLTLTRPSPLVIAAGTTFTAAGGRTFRTTQSFAGRLSAGDIVSDGDRLVVTQPDGTAVVTIDVVADVAGAAGQLRLGDLLTPTRALPGVTRAQAAADFSGGVDAESLSDVVARLEVGVAARGWSTAAGVAALVRSCPGFESAAVSVVGAGQVEQLRDRHGVFPISTGNRLDVWVRPPGRLSVQTATVSARYVSGAGAAATWVLDIPRGVLSGAAHVTGLTRVGRAVAAGVTAWDTELLYAAEPGDPDISTGLEAANSPYQKLRLTFSDLPGNEILIPNVTTVDYAVTALVVPALGTLQAWLYAPERAPLFGDVVVRSAVPCRTTLRIEITRLGADVPTADIAAALAGHVNRSGFPGHLYASELAVIVDARLPADVHVRRIRMTGYMYAPGNRRYVAQDDAVLSAAYLPAEYVTARTVAFTLDTGDIVFEVVA